MNQSTRKTLTFAVAIASFALLTGNAFADTTWQKDHPRRTEVNARLNNQDRRIHQDVKDGDMSRSQAAALHQDDRQIRTEERDMASQNGSHITKGEQNVLNQQENAVGKQIGY
jgi:hypothetical protein